jgi:hypothetical protein
MARRLAALEKRLSAIERRVFAEGIEDCKCRVGQQTRYHTATELKKIMDVRCSVHGIRDLGNVSWIPRGLPLHPDDRELCSCPPYAVRDFAQGVRGPLALEEEELWERTWQREYTRTSTTEFRHEQARAEALLQAYPQKERKR